MEVVPRRTHAEEAIFRMASGRRHLGGGILEEASGLIETLLELVNGESRVGFVATLGRGRAFGVGKATEPFRGSSEMLIRVEGFRRMRLASPSGDDKTVGVL